MLPSQADKTPGRNGKLSAEPEATKFASLVAKRPKLEQTQRRGHPPAFWDNLSRLWLTRRALCEFDRRATQRNPYLQWEAGDLKPVNAPSLKRFARRGGPNLSDIRAYPEPDTSTSFPQSMDSQSCKRKADEVEESALDSGGKPPKSRKTTAYDKNFEQNLIDHGVFPEGFTDQAPINVEAITTTWSEQRRSLSPSNFTEDSYKEFKRRNREASTEDDVKETILPIIKGSTNIPGSRNVEFNNLAPLTDGNIATDKPDYYEGSRPTDLEPQVRKDLNNYIVPSTNKSRPCLPNFFTEVKRPDGSWNVLARQACYAGAMGARAMHELRLYVNKITALDGNAYTIVSTYDSGSGTLELFTTHPTAPENSKRTVDYSMTQLGSFALKHNCQVFRQGATAFRNARDWAQKKRKELIDAANAINQSEPEAELAT